MRPTDQDDDDDWEVVAGQLERDRTFPSMNESARSSIRFALGSPSIRNVRLSSPRPHHPPKRPHTISQSLRWTTNIAALFSCFLLTGIIFGWAPLKLILLREGQYHEYCSSDSDSDVCVAQLDHYNVIFTMAQFSLSFGSLFVGILMDYASKARLYVIVALIQVSGLVLFGLSQSSTLDYFAIGYILLAVGGCITMLAGFPASFLLPRHQPAILAANSCLFDASSIVFAIFNFLEYNFPITCSRQNMFLAYAVLAIVVYGVLAVCWYKLEHSHWKAVIEEESQQLQQSKQEPDENGNKQHESSQEDPHKTHVRRIGMHDQTIWQQLRSFEFALVLIFASSHMLRCNFYIGTVNEMLYRLGDTTFYYSKMFGFVLPVGIFFVPLIDDTIRRIGILPTLHVTNLMGMVFGAMMLIPSLHVQAIAFFMFAGFRAYLYATISTFIALTFGVSTMGRMVGSCFTSASIVSLLILPAATVAERTSAGGKDNFTMVNIIMLAICAIPSFMVMRYQRAQQQVLAAQVPGEDQALLSEAGAAT
jgi:MFS transporter, LAT3 family, solute carrier family 43, member 3